MDAALKPSKSNRITTLQFILIIHSMQLGVGIISMPKDVADVSGTDGWIAIILGWILSTAASLIIVQVMKKYPDGSIIDLIEHYFGKWIGKLAMALFAVYFLLYAYLIFDRMVLLTQSWIMQQTQSWVLMLLFVIPAYMLIKGGVRDIGRFAEITFFASIWMVFVISTLFKDGNWLHLLPVLKEGWLPVIRTVNTTILSFLGFECIFFIYPHLEKKQSASKGVIIANTLTMLIYLFITIICFLVFSPDEITFFNDAVISAVKIIEFRFIERFDLLILSIYLMVIAKTWISALFMSVYCTSRLIVGKYYVHAGIFLVAMVITNYALNTGWNESIEASGYFSKIGFAVAFIGPVCLWLVLLVMSQFKRWQT
ncbi:spore germination protein (amino acid permease) [Paenibacillus taihuensis]|uniref:Spore germination protein (Amino acid permease) n=1 Tax=Paenibacillus taihuensis TaxID=1156355 RepID=A0A3D9RMZ0_9BACL|nr:endospore germination permease [Paenibacillus taihuensis]REE81269.1 spore germination protein (amino acid permease) [Paenibacillus taihuensis]